MMAIIVPRAANWVAESTLTKGSGAVALAGPIEGFAPFSVMGDGPVYYTIQEGDNKETGIGNINGGSLERTTVQAVIINGQYNGQGPSPMPLQGFAEVYCTVNADLLNKIFTVVGKVAGIEDGATADQSAAEVPYDSTNNPLTDDSQLQSAIDELSNYAFASPAAALADVKPDDVKVLGNGTVLLNTTTFLDKNTYQCYTADSPISGTITSIQNVGLSNKQITVAPISGSPSDFVLTPFIPASKLWVNTQITNAGLDPQFKTVKLNDITVAANSVVSNPLFNKVGLNNWFLARVDITNDDDEVGYNVRIKGSLGEILYESVYHKGKFSDHQLTLIEFSTSATIEIENLSTTGSADFNITVSYLD